MVFAPHVVVISRVFLSALLCTSHVYLKLLIISFLAYVYSDCLFGQRNTGNFRFERRLSCHCQQLCCKYVEGVQQHSSMGLACFGRHLIHNIVTAGVAALKNNVHNPLQTEARQRKQVLER